MAGYEPYPADSAAQQSATAPYGQQERGPRPDSVKYAEWLVWAKIALGVVSGVVTLLLLDTIVSDAIAKADFQGDPPDTSLVRTFAMVGALVGMLVSVVVMGTLAFFLHRGANWARITYTVLVALGLLVGIQGLVRNNASSPAVLVALGVLGLVMSAAVLVLLWRPASTAWFTRR